MNRAKRITIRAKKLPEDLSARIAAKIARHQEGIGIAVGPFHLMNSTSSKPSPEKSKRWKPSNRACKNPSATPVFISNRVWPFPQRLRGCKR